ncbi:tryptophan 2,3-dioxygenase family protein [Streptomyces sp. DW26H14]|uniref:tryptophan 2,3-dioxygenase family protein n=1 Tax=Streptomyces sp. DW26H14 TaxID=3435395 RepID=UPI00403DBC42
MTSPTYATYLRLEELLALQHPLTPAEQCDLSDSERLFIVVHQASETLLSQVLVDLRHIAAGECGEQCFADRAERAARLVDALSEQLTLLRRTLRQEDFLRFRDRFGTASGLDSEQFRALFALMKDLAAEGKDGPPLPEREFKDLDEAIRRWRQTHWELVGHMLGDRPGTGQTSGADFLAARIDGTELNPTSTDTASTDVTKADTASTDVTNAELTSTDVTDAGGERPSDATTAPGPRVRDGGPRRTPATRPGAGRGTLGRVVVLGGSVAGLLAARVLADRARQVTVLERDRYEDGPVPRAGVPQSRHTHVLLAGGMNALDRLLPGLVPELRDADAPRLAVPGEVGVWQAGRWISRRNPSAPIMTPSRPLLELAIRTRVLADPRIEVRTGVEATGLLGRPDEVTGVLLRARGGDDGDPPEELAADLVVDATGRASRTPRWLAALGAPALTEEVVETGRAYATCVFTGEGPAHDLRGFYIVPDSGQPIGSILLPAEGDRWMVTLSGPRGQEPPTDVEGFVDFARLLPHPAPHDWLRSARPVSRPVGYRHTANRRRRYDRLPGDRRGLLVVGDAVCALNPVYGQGVSVAALNAVALARELAGGRLPSVAALQRAIVRSSGAAWTIATGADSPMPGVSGNAVRSGPVTRLLTRYLDRVRDHVPGDPVVCAANRDVLFLLAPPRALLSPRVVRRSLLSPPVPTPRGLPTP